jgi:hypothetical protein
MTTQAQVQTAVLSLGPLPEDVAARILLSLPLLLRCRCECVCRGWLKFLRAAQHHAALNTRDVTAALRAEGRCLTLSRDAEEEAREDDEEDDEQPLSTASALAALASRAGGSLRSLSVAGDGHLRALLPALRRAQPALAALALRDVTAGALVAALPRGALPAACAAQRVSLSASALATTLPAPPDGGIADGDDSVACQLLRRSGVSLATLSLCLDDAFLSPEEEDDEWADDPRAVRCLRLGRMLALAAWRRVSVSLPPCIGDDLGQDGATLAILLETLLLGLAGGDGVAALPAEAHARAVLDARCGVALSVRDVARVAAAVPPFARLLLNEVSCTEQHIIELPRALRAGRVAAATLRLGEEGGEAVGAASLARALAALGVAIDAADADAAADAAAGAPPLHAHARADDASGGFGLEVFLDGAAATCALLCAWLRERPAALRYVGVCVHDAAQLNQLLAALAGSSVHRLALWGDGLNDANVIACVAPALAAHTLPPALVQLCMFGTWIPTAEAVRALADALRTRTTPLQLLTHSSNTVAGMLDELSPLIARAHAGSGMPLLAACKLSEFVTVLQGSGEEHRRRYADGIAALAAPLFAALARHCVDHDDDDDEDDDHDDYDRHRRRDNELPPSNLAALLLFADAHADMRAALRPTSRVLLLASRVRRARWPAAPSHALRFTPALHAALLHWARAGRDADATPRVLGEVAAACARAAPVCGAYSPRQTEARIAACTALLACGLAGAAGCADSDVQLAAASAWLAAHAECVLELLTRLMDAAADKAAAPFGVLPGLPARAGSVADAALHLSAAAHVPALRSALWDLPGFPAFLLRVLTGRPGDDAAAIDAAIACDDVAHAATQAAVHGLLVAGSPAQWHVLLTTWAVTDQANKLAPVRMTKQQSKKAVAGPPSCLERATAALTLAAKGRLSAAVAAVTAAAAGSDAGVWSQASNNVLAARAAATHAAAALTVLQRRAAAPPPHSAQHMAAVAAVLRGMRLDEGGEGTCARARVRAAMLHAGALRWAREGRSRDATPALLAELLAACVRVLPEAARLTPLEGRDAVLTSNRDGILATLLLCGLLGDDDALSPAVLAARTWLKTHQACVLPLIAAMPRATSAADASTVTAALYLTAACRVAPLRAAFAASGAAFAALASGLLLTRWCAASAAAAAGAYGALARLLDEPCGCTVSANAPPPPVTALLARWRAEADARVAQALPLYAPTLLAPPFVQADATTSCTPLEAVTHLAEELTRATAAQRASRSDDECDAAAAAATHLTVLLRVLLEQLPLHAGRGGVVASAIRKGRGW